MNPALRELLRNGLLLQLAAYPPRGLTFGTIAIGVRIAGFRVTDEEIAAEITYLQDKGLATALDKTISPENRRIRITAAGRDHLATEGLL